MVIHPLRPEFVCQVPHGIPLPEHNVLRPLRRIAFRDRGGAGRGNNHGSSSDHSEEREAEHAPDHRETGGSPPGWSRTADGAPAAASAPSPRLRTCRHRVRATRRKRGTWEIVARVGPDAGDGGHSTRAPRGSGRTSSTALAVQSIALPRGVTPDRPGRPVTPRRPRTAIPTNACSISILRTLVRMINL